MFHEEIDQIEQRVERCSACTFMSKIKQMEVSHNN